jgi:Uncharacterised nucleotidyltransferase
LESLTPSLMPSGLARAVASTALRHSDLRLPRAPLDDAAWQRLLAEVQSQHLVGLLASAVEESRLPVRSEQVAEVREAHAHSMQVCLALESDLLAAAAVLDDAGVEHRVLKGPAFAHLDYPDASLREFSDIDLLVRSQQYDTAVAALTAAGYRRRYKEVRAGFDHRFGKGASFTGPHGREIDLHRTFVMGPFGLTIVLADLWIGDERFQLAGRTFTTLDADQRFLHACFHAALGDVRIRLVPLRDLVTMLQRAERPIDPERLRQLSRRWRADVVVARAVRMAWDAFALSETRLSEWAAAYRPSRNEQRAMRTYLEPSLGYAARSYAALRAVPGIRAKAAFAFALAVPDRSFGSGRHTGRWQRWWEAARQIAALTTGRRRV